MKKIQKIIEIVAEMLYNIPRKFVMLIQYEMEEFMKLHDDYYEEERSSGSKMTYIYMLLIMSAVILGVTALVFWSNQSKSKSDGSGYAADRKSVV